MREGKELKEVLKNQKAMKSVIQPMGSNFESLLPEIGVTAQEKGEVKKANSKEHRITFQEYKEKYSTIESTSHMTQSLT